MQHKSWTLRRTYMKDITLLIAGYCDHVSFRTVIMSSTNETLETENLQLKKEKYIKELESPLQNLSSSSTSERNILSYSWI